MDLDMYLYDSAGNEVTSSIAGGTDELIELVVPPDDTWTLYVHGWQTAWAPVDFEPQTSAVPATPSTGAEVIDDAPSDATIGAVGAVAASLTGLDPGSECLGAVSHSSASNLIGLTLVDITTSSSAEVMRRWPEGETGRSATGGRASADVDGRVRRVQPSATGVAGRAQ